MNKKNNQKKKVNNPAALRQQKIQALKRENDLEFMQELESLLKKYGKVPQINFVDAV